MITKQYERWKDFAMRMARVLYRANRRPSGEWVLNCVEGFFASLNEWDIPCIVDWDHSDEYPEGHCCHGRDRYGHVNRPYPVTDMVSIYLDECQGYSPRCHADEQWGGPVRCCVRAGLDLASSPSMGVCGFTAGDIRRMYPEGIPDWLREKLDAYDAFAEWSDDTHVWL